jgi:hypothetical protein
MKPLTKTKTPAEAGVFGRSVNRLQSNHLITASRHRNNARQESVFPRSPEFFR